jgi:hypothetical protein
MRVESAEEALKLLLISFRTLEDVKVSLSTLLSSTDRALTDEACPTAGAETPRVPGEDVEPLRGRAGVVRLCAFDAI